MGTQTYAEYPTQSGAAVTIRRHGRLVRTYTADCSGCQQRLTNGPDEKGYPASRLDGVVLWAEFHSAECDRSN